MRIDFSTSFPIYLQIKDGFKRQIAAGVLKAGDKIPSQRDLAVQLKVNANTVQRAYREMEILGLVQTLRGQGTFVTQDVTMVKKMRTEMQANRVDDFVQEMRSLGCSQEEVLVLIQSRWPGIQNKGKEVEK